MDAKTLWGSDKKCTWCVSIMFEPVLGLAIGILGYGMLMAATLVRAGIRGGLLSPPPPDDTGSIWLLAILLWIAVFSCVATHWVKNVIGASRVYFYDEDQSLHCHKKVNSPLNRDSKWHQWWTEHPELIVVQLRHGGSAPKNIRETVIHRISNKDSSGNECK